MFDARSHWRDQDLLNAKLRKGLDFNLSIVALLFQFRIGRVADLQKVFLQIRVHPVDRDFLRFLWIDSSGHLQAYRMTSVPFGATCSQFLLATVIRHHLLNNVQINLAASKFLGNIYVDDLVITTDTSDQMRKIHSDSVSLFLRCSMNLHKWRVSDCQLDTDWADADAAEETKMLGVRW